MFLRLGSIEIANSDTDARVCALAVAKPSLSLPNHEDLDIIGINTDIKYQFKTGEILANSTAILVGGNVLSVSDFAVTINEPF